MARGKKSKRQTTDSRNRKDNKIAQTVLMEPAPDKPDAAASQPPPKKDQRQAQPLWRKYLPTTDVSMAVLTAGLLIFSGLQWLATRDSIDLTERAFKVGNRAYVCVKEANIYSALKDTFGAPADQIGLGQGVPPPFLKVVIVNSGMTPAIKLFGHAHMVIRDKILSSDDEQLHPVESQEIPVTQAGVVVRRRLALDEQAGQRQRQ